MKAMAAGKIKTHFSEILEEAENGKQRGVLYGKAKKPAAMVPYSKAKKTERKIGILDGNIKIEFGDDFEMTPEELLGMQ
jgi:antitoxin (DNA-binding transcriptional repressor) of toxin-antitoxin stability system